MSKVYESLRQVKLICDEKAEGFQRLMQRDKPQLPDATKKLYGHRVWQMFFDFHLELLKAERDEVPANEVPENFAPYGGRDRDQMEAEAEKAEEPVIGDANRLKPNGDPLQYLKHALCSSSSRSMPAITTNHYFYPQDISPAQEGDIWHDLDGRPHFCLGGGWIEARGFKPKTVNFIDVRFKSGQFDRGYAHAFFWSSVIAFKEVL